MVPISHACQGQDMIKRNLMLLFVLPGLSSCESAVGPSFDKMSETELATYNASLPTDEQVICQDAYADWVGGRYRRIPKLCLTVREMERQRRLAEAVSSSGLRGGANPGAVVC